MSLHSVQTKKRTQVWCSFCGKEYDEVFALVAGLNVFICDECIAAAQQIVTDKKIAAGASAVIGRIGESKE